ncbi:hypothetical protein CDEST_02924 [Colletotrichum destructivum]|uniref:Uncharacterized protein n=1 Tax=Colletotrichum destructivum TaxID=34406 RepID=A0AAX4I4J1_9PEZI|nr:hypothetical protein CDEST_02924 [Colletotrichum destructivum]
MNPDTPGIMGARWRDSGASEDPGALNGVHGKQASQVVMVVRANQASQVARGPWLMIMAGQARQCNNGEADQRSQ